MIFIQTERLVLRNVAAKDAAIMYDYRNHPRCARYQRGQTKSREGIAALVERHKADTLCANAPFMLAAALKTTDELVGEIVVMPQPCTPAPASSQASAGAVAWPQDGTISLGYTFCYKHHRKGYAFEALAALLGLLHATAPAWELICFTEPENQPSIALLQKLGCRNMGYLPAKSSVVFGKWLKPATEAEILQATAH